MECTEESQKSPESDKKSLDEFSIVIVGVGPNGTYAMGRLAAEFSAIPPPLPVRIHVIEKSGQFGAGWVHSPTQPHSSMLNRIVGQIAFECDESNSSARHLLPKSLRPTFHQWCQNKFKATRDPRFNLAAEDWPQRYIHGQALVDIFKKYVEVLRALPLVSVDLHHSEATSVEECGSRYLVKMSRDSTANVVGDHILFTTGHSKNKPKSGSYEERLIRFSQNSQFYYSPFAYPLEANVKPEVTSNKYTVACVGLGLTAIDVFLYLTEGRGGEFLKDGPNGRLKYIRSGAEPKKIVGFSRSGVFTAARAFNSKQVDLDKFQHRGEYLTPATIDKLRESLGTEVSDCAKNEIRQLDFERHLFPIVYLEMAILYYKVLFGISVSKKIKYAVNKRFDQFTEGSAGGVYADHELGVAYFEQLIQPVIDSTTQIIERFLSNSSDLNVPLTVEAQQILSTYFSTVFGQEYFGQFRQWLVDGDLSLMRDWVLKTTSQYSHSTNPQDQTFNWKKIIEPVSPDSFTDGAEFVEKLIDYMDYDNLKGLQGNIFNPEKAACDGVWRDLRPVLAHAADYGGFTADSHIIFIKKYMRYHNRIANGTSVEIMEKMSALIRSGVLDVSVGPNPAIEECNGEPCVQIVGRQTGVSIKVDTIIDAKLHDLNIDLDEMPLYRSLLQNGFINRWRYPSEGSRTYVPGGIELTKEFHPIDQHGTENRSFTFLGPASEGVMFFQVGAARPFQNHHVLNDIILWSEEVFEQIGNKVRTPTSDSNFVEHIT